MASQHKTSKVSGLARFITEDHRYVFLGTSVIAALGLWFSQQPHSTWSFLRYAYPVEAAMFYILVVWIIISGLALVDKLALWKHYAQESGFVRASTKHDARICSYIVWVLAAVLFVDRAVMGFCAIVSSAISSGNNPSDFLSSAAYMVWNGREVFVRGIVTTVELAVFGTIIAFFLALLLVFLRVQSIDRPDNDFVRFLKVIGNGFARFYSAVVRGTPMMIQGMLVYFAGFAVLRGTGMTAGEIGAVWSTFVAGLTTISLNSTAYMMEVLRGGIEAVDPGQTEAARSLGLSQWQAMSKVVFPQGIKNAIPALSNELVVNIKDSSVLSVIGVFDLMFATTTVAGIYYRQLEIYAAAAVVYLILTMVASKLLSILARHLDAGKPGPLLSTSDAAVTQGTSVGQAKASRLNFNNDHSLSSQEGEK